MKATVTNDFIDRDTGAVHRVGDVVEYEKDRADELSGLGFVKVDKPAPARKQTSTAKKSRAKE